jgi:hypothetical protein
MEIHVQSQSINISIIDCGRRKTARKSFQNHQHPKVHAIFTMCFLLFEPFFFLVKPSPQADQQLNQLDLCKIYL